MKRLALCLIAIILLLGVLFYAVSVIGGYVFDRVNSYVGPTPMALDTAICLVCISAGCLLLVNYLIPVKGGH